MSFEPKTQAFNSSISSVTIGTGDKAVTLGGINVLPFYAFDAPITNAPKIGVEITDHGMAAYPQAGLQEFYAGCQTVADMAKRVETMHGASFICLHFEGADPNGDNRSVEECVEIAKSVADATDLPLVIMGCKNIEKDAELFTKVSEALQGKNILVFSAREENYKSVGASAVMAYGTPSPRIQKVRYLFFLAFAYIAIPNATETPLSKQILKTYLHQVHGFPHDPKDHCPTFGM